MKRPLNMLPVKSSSVESVFHDQHGLHVRFKGGAHYVYPEATRRDYGQLLAADSIGAHALALGKQFKGVKL